MLCVALVATVVGYGWGAMDSMQGVYYGHTKPETGPEEWQLLQDHLVTVAKMASQFAEPFNAERLAYLAGLWHDLGKYSEEFQRYIASAGGESAHMETHKGKVDHSTAGAQYAHGILREAGNAAAGTIIAFTIAGHHAGLPPKNSAGRSSLKDRLEKRIPPFEHGLEQLPTVKCDSDIKPPPIRQGHAGFDLAMFIRMLFSSLVDADFLDTEAFMDPGKSVVRLVQTADLRRMRDELAVFMDNLVPDPDSERGRTPVNVARREVLGACLRNAELGRGFYSLTVPTGGGKTLSSLSFALRHAVRNGQRRVIYAVPYTSIIEQTASTFRTVFEEALGERAVLEHHNNYVTDERHPWTRLAAENWDAPLVVTTNVQFFESLFASRTSKCRKLHNIAGSVIVLDEAQMLPVTQLKPTLEALQCLVANYGCTVVLCTATQPALHKRNGFDHGIEDVHEIVPDPRDLYERLKRVNVELHGTVGLADVANWMVERQQALAVVSTKRDASELFAQLRQRSGETNTVYHLSANMCPVHRSTVLEEIRRRLRNGRPCRVVSTQLIEAGVDIDFPVVFRSIAGIDSIAQAAGRCNREGRLPAYGEVHVFQTEQGPPPGFLRNAAQVTERVAPKHPDLLGLDAVHHYFDEFYLHKEMDEKGVSSLTSSSRLARSLDFDFPEIDQRYRLIDDDSESLVVPLDDYARGLVKKVEQNWGAREALRKLQVYTVSVRSKRMRELEENGAIRRVCDEYPVLERMALYDRKYLGLTVGPVDDYSPNELMLG